ncbi:acyl-CoA dehydrogenase family protein [Phenylobacterium sp.]|uniref:acyl-CoA dehydrogenase family protein n=1 Tax=Phenylobacterium sp. TaxID=1871053 RepID=UPI00301BF8C2
MDFELSQETKALKDLVRKLIEKHQMPLERKLLQGEAITAEDLAPGRKAAKDAGLWGLSLPKEYGGADLSTVDNVAVAEENARCLVPLAFGGRVPAFVRRLNDRQKEKYFHPLLRDEKSYAFAQTEPSGGSDPGGQIRTNAVRKGDRWVLNGSKIFISNVARADFFIVVAVTDLEKRQHGGITLFLVDRDAPGVRIGRAIPMIGARTTHELFFEDVELDDDAVVGRQGTGFASAQGLLSGARLNIGARALGVAERCVEMMIEHAKARVAFGELLASKQAVQASIVDSWVDVHQTRLVTYHAAWKQDRGLDTRVEAGLVKFLGSEMVGRVVDRALQLHGAAGAAFDSPLAHWYTDVRTMRIFEGPTDVQRYQVVARSLLK